MEELINLSTQLHIVFVVLLVGLIGANIYLIKSKKTFFNLSKRLELLAPQYYIVLSAIFFTGLIVMAVRQFAFSFAVWEMIVAWIILIALGIRGHKIYKRVEKTDASQTSYKTFAFKKYLIDLIIVVSILVLTYGVH